MFCPKCSKINPDDALECSGCGASLVKEEPPKKKLDKKKIIKTVIMVALVAAVVVAIVVLTGCAKKPADMNVSY